jgi:hypothetical protein
MEQTEPGLEASRFRSMAMDGLEPLKNPVLKVKSMDLEIRPSHRRIESMNTPDPNRIFVRFATSRLQDLKICRIEYSPHNVRISGGNTEVVVFER